MWRESWADGLRRALWGWDDQDYVPGCAQVVCGVDGGRMGLRFCYEARFAECFRGIFREQVDLAPVALANVGDS